jgi:hypothetical protein
VIVVTVQDTQAASADTAEPRQLFLWSERAQSPIAIFTITFGDQKMHDADISSDNAYGIVLAKGSGIPQAANASRECKAVIAALLNLDEVAFVILPAQHGSNMLDVGYIESANEDAIMLHVGLVLRSLGVNVVNRKL